MCVLDAIALEFMLFLCFNITFSIKQFSEIIFIIVHILCESVECTKVACKPICSDCVMVSCVPYHVAFITGILSVNKKLLFHQLLVSSDSIRVGSLPTHTP